MFAGIVADARANLRQKVILNLEFMVLLTSMFWLLRDYGLLGIAAAIGTGEIVRTFLYMRITHNDIGIRYRQLLAMYLPGLLNAAAVGVGILVVSLGLRAVGSPALVTLIAQIAMGGLALGIVVLRWPSSELHPHLQQGLNRLRNVAGLPTPIHASLARYATFLERQQPLFPSFEPLTSSLTP